MAATCPSGHQSSTDDYCDVCGAPIGGASTPTPAPSPPPPAATIVASSGPAVACPNCGTQNSPDALFCEDCGYDFTTGQAPAVDPDPSVLPDPAAAGLAEWQVEVAADRDFYAVKATSDTDAFPTDPQSRTIPLTGHVALIGRESASRGIHPEIDAGDDSAVSRRHAQLVHSGDQWQVVDLGSTNGTTVAKAGQAPDPDPLPSGQPRALADGDAVLVGAWTRVTLHHVAAAA